MKYTIIGAGIGGLTTAVAFEQKGIDYQIFERTPEIKEVGAGIWLSPNSLQIIESLGLLNKIQLAGNTLEQINIAKKDLNPISATNQDFVKKQFGYTTTSIHRAELQQILLSQIPSNKIELGKDFKNYSELNTGKIKVEFEDNTSTETDYLIGADGINSKVRKQLFPTSEIRYAGQTCWRGVSDFEMPKAYAQTGMELWGDQVRFGLSKIADGKVYWFAVAKAIQNGKDDKTKIKKQLLDTYKNYDKLVTDIIKHTADDKILRNDISDLKPLEKWHKGNICLIGDAGHATTPNMGQGGAQAIEDAYYLSNLIEQNPNKNVFDSFQNKRVKKVNNIVKTSWQIGKMAHWKYGTGLRNFLLKNTPTKMMYKKMMEVYGLVE